MAKKLIRCVCIGYIECDFTAPTGKVKQWARDAIKLTKKTNERIENENSKISFKRFVTSPEVLPIERNFFKEMQTLKITFTPVINEAKKSK